MTDIFLDMHPYEHIGMAGFGLYIAAFTGLTLGVLKGEGILYFVLSMLSALMILTGLTISFNMAAAYMQGFKVMMCVLAITMRVTKTRKARADMVPPHKIDIGQNQTFRPRSAA